MGEISTLDLIADEDVAITVTNTGYIKRTTLDEYRKQARGGKGLKGMTVKEEDAVSHLFVASTHSYILIFAKSGQASTGCGSTKSRTSRATPRARRS